MKTIIAATDLTDRSANVLGRALALAGPIGARVVFAHVISPGAPAARAEDARRRMQALVAETPGSGTPEIRVLQGRPEVELPALADAEEAGLLVLGLHRTRPVLDLLRLTTMERIVLRTDQPVLIAHIDARRPYRRVLGSVDFAPACAAALAAAARLAPDAEFRAIHALQLQLRERLGTGDITYSRTMTQAEALRASFLQRPGLPPSLHLPEIVEGGVHEVLRFLIDELQPELVTIGTHSGREPLLLGNYARDLMREPPTDVLVAKPPRS